MFKKLYLLLLYTFSKKYFLNVIGIQYGKNCRFIKLKRSTFGSEPYLIKLGDHVTIASGVKFITHDGGAWVMREEFPDIDVFGKIVVGNNVFIGLNSILLPGTSIGNNVVIGAGSVVTKKLESNAIYAGVPARKVCSLESYKDRMIEKSMNTKKLNPADKKVFLINQINRL